MKSIKEYLFGRTEVDRVCIHPAPDTEKFARLLDLRFDRHAVDSEQSHVHDLAVLLHEASEIEGSDFHIEVANDLRSFTETGQDGTYRWRCEKVSDGEGT